MDACVPKSSDGYFEVASRCQWGAGACKVLALASAFVPSCHSCTWYPAGMTVKWYFRCAYTHDTSPAGSDHYTKCRV
eukprot:3582553-Pleurochrysis_carterae.AAC.1